MATTLVDHVRTLYRHLVWADRRVLDALASQPEVPDQVRHWMAHVVAAEDIWLRRIEGDSLDCVEVFPDHDLATIQAEATRLHVAYKVYLGGIDDTALGHVVQYQTTSGAPYATAVLDILTHVALHGAYHRGQIAASLRAGGHTPASTDYILFVRS